MTQWNVNIYKIELLYRYIPVYDIHGNRILCTVFSYENNILKVHSKEYTYWSLPEISTDASLWDVTFEGTGLRPVINGSYSKTDKIFDDEITDYVILNNGSNV